MSTSVPFCSRCNSLPCCCYTAPPALSVTTRIEPYFVYERIAVALERIAAAMEASNQDKRPQ